MSTLIEIIKDPSLDDLLTARGVIGYITREDRTGTLAQKLTGLLPEHENPKLKTIKYVEPISLTKEEQEAAHISLCDASKIKAGQLKVKGLLYYVLRDGNIMTLRLLLNLGFLKCPGLNTDIHIIEPISMLLNEILDFWGKCSCLNYRDCSGIFYGYYYYRNILFSQGETYTERLDVFKSILTLFHIMVHIIIDNIVSQETKGRLTIRMHDILKKYLDKKQTPSEIVAWFSDAFFSSVQTTKGYSTGVYARLYSELNEELKPALISPDAFLKLIGSENNKCPPPNPNERGGSRKVRRRRRRKTTTKRRTA
jgi:hypothetical protein